MADSKNLRDLHWEAVLALVTGTARLKKAPGRADEVQRVIAEGAALAEGFEAYRREREQTELHEAASKQQADRERALQAGRTVKSSGNPSQG